MKAHAPIVRAAIALALVTSVVSANAGPRSTPARRLRAPEHIRAETQAELTARMGRHGQTMSILVRAVVLLDRPTIRELARRIADEEVVARASRSVHERPPLLLPEGFYLQQTKLAVAARDLAAAADGSDDGILAERFATVTGTCVACHSAYVHGRPD